MSPLERCTAPSGEDLTLQQIYPSFQLRGRDISGQPSQRIRGEARNRLW